jgi:hypothetical protein
LGRRQRLGLLRRECLQLRAAQRCDLLACERGDLLGHERGYLGRGEHLWDRVGGCFPIVQALRVDAIADSGQTYGGRAFRDCHVAFLRDLLSVETHCGPYSAAVYFAKFLRNSPLTHFLSAVTWPTFHLPVARATTTTVDWGISTPPALFALPQGPARLAARLHATRQVAETSGQPARTFRLRTGARIGASTGSGAPR